MKLMPIIMMVTLMAIMRDDTGDGHDDDMH